MFVYILIFLMIFFLVLVHYQWSFKKSARSFLKSLTFLVLLVFIGLRHEVGGDWFSYLRWYERIESSGLSLSLESIFLGDFGYNFLNWLSSKLRLGIYGVNTMCAFIFLIGLFKFLEIFENDRDFYLGLLIAYPYLIMVVGNGYTRQSVALGLVFWSYRLLLNEKNAKAFSLLSLAFLFHKTSAVGFIAFLFRRSSRKFLFLMIGALLLFYAYLEQLFERYYGLYVENPMISEGGFLRAMMNLLPALVFLITYRTFKKRYPDSSFWLLFTTFTLFLSVFSVFKFTFADRLLLYFSAVQPLVLVRLRKIIPRAEQKALILILILSAYAAAMLVWLLFAVHAPSWIPYKNLLII